MAKTAIDSEALFIAKVGRSVGDSTIVKRPGDAKRLRAEQVKE